MVTAAVVCIGWAVGLFVGLQAVVGAETLALFGGTDSPLATVVFLTLIVGLGLGTWVAGRVWHGRSHGALIGRGPRT